MDDTKKVLDSIKDKIPFTPIDDRILVKPLKPVKVKRSESVPVDDEGKVIPFNEIDHSKNYKTKRVSRTVDSNMTKGVVLKIGKTGQPIPTPFNEGDVVVFPSGAGMPFELFKDSKLLKRYEIMGLWNDEQVVKNSEQLLGKEIYF